MNTIKLQFCPQTLPLIFLLLFISGIFSTGNSYKDINHLAEKKKVLTQKIDSLDLLKQKLKRNGLPIVEVEQHQKMLRDSLHFLRSYIQTTSEITPATPNGSNKFYFFQKPSNLFDWIIVIVGIIATFSGLMLAVGIFRTLGSKKRIRIYPKQKREKSTPARENMVENSKKPAAAYPDYRQTSVTSTYSSYPTTENADTLEHLRKRLDIQSDSVNDDISENPAVPQSRTKINRDTVDNIEQKVLIAARNGYGVAEISRQFQLSIDHISLILKVAEKKPQKN
jgi:hypothetical protein